MQKELGKQRGNWVIALQKCDLEFKPAIIIKGQGFCKLIEYNQTEKDPDWENGAGVNLIYVCPIFTTPEYWYRDLVYYIQQGYLLEHWRSKHRRSLRLKSSPYQVMDGVLFRKNYDGVLLRCMER